MTVVRELLAKLGIDGSDYERGINKAIGQTNNLNSTFTRLSTFGGNLLYGAFTLATTGAALLGYELYKDVQAASDAQAVEAQLNAVLKSTGQIAGVTADQVKSLASEWASLTPYEDEAVIGAENILLTFTSLTKDVFPDALGIVLDMSTALGQDLKSSAIQVGKALQDPIEGANALKRVGVNLSDATQKLIKDQVESGNLMAAQAIIMRELQTEFGGSAKAAGQTFGGQLTILKNKIGDIRELIGNKFLPVLSQLATTFSEYLTRPETLAFIEGLASRLATLVMWGVEMLPKLAIAIQNSFGWLQNNQGVIVGALAAIGVAIMAFVYTVAIPAIVAWVSAFWPVVLIMGVVALAAYLVYQAWQANFGGIQQIVKRFAAFILDMFFRIRFHLINAIPQALEFFRKTWQTKFLPILQKAKEWIDAHFTPLLRELGILFSVVLAKSIELASAVFQKYLLPSLQRTAGFINSVLLPVVRHVGMFIAITFVQGIRNLGLAMDWLVIRIRTLSSYLRNLEIPAWLTPGSPTPLELGILGIASAMRTLDRVTMPAFQSPSLQTVGASAFSGGSVDRTIHLVVQAQDLKIEKVIEVIDEKAEELVTALKNSLKGTTNG